jgi:hypothetical protein
MHPVAAGLEGEIGPVIEQKGDAPPLGQRPQRVDRAADGIVVDILEAQLQAGDVAGIERGGELLGEARQIGKTRRGDQIKTAGSGNGGPRR